MNENKLATIINKIFDDAIVDDVRKSLYLEDTELDKMFLIKELHDAYLYGCDSGSVSSLLRTEDCFNFYKNMKQHIEELKIDEIVLMMYVSPVFALRNYDDFIVQCSWQLFERVALEHKQDILLAIAILENEY